MALKSILKKPKPKARVSVSFKDDMDELSDNERESDGDSNDSDSDKEVIAQIQSKQASIMQKKREALGEEEQMEQVQADSDDDEYDINDDADTDSVPDLDTFDADDDESERGDTFGNAGWADALMKVLKTKAPKKKKQLILSRGITDEELEKKQSKKKDPTSKIEVVDSEGKPIKRLSEVDDEGPSSKKKKLDEDEETKEKKRKIAREKWEMLGRVKPTPEDRLRERTLSSIATKGVVQLFNAVKEQQKVTTKKLSKVKNLDSARDSILAKLADEDKFLERVRTAPVKEGETSTESGKEKPAKSESDSSSEEKTPASSKVSSKGQSKKTKKSAGWKVLDDNYLLEKHNEEAEGSDF